MTGGWVAQIVEHGRTGGVTASRSGCATMRSRVAHRIDPATAAGGGMTEREKLLDELRPVAFAIAYRMLGSVSEAEDVVQEALLRVHQTLEAGEEIESPRAFTATVTTRLSINELRSARAQRERYFGEWLPEPIITDGEDDPARHAETADSLSVAMLALLERLSPEQRAVLLLHDVFDYRYARSPRSSARARTTCASSAPARGATSRSTARASRRRASSATSCEGFSPPPSRAISRDSSRCSPPTSS